MDTTNIPGLNGVNDEKRDAYLNNYRTHRIGIRAEEMVRNYTLWANEGTYDKVHGTSDMCICIERAQFLYNQKK